MIVKVPLDSAWMSGKYQRHSQFTGVRDRWSPEVIARRDALVDKIAALFPPGIPLAQAALRYILAQSEVSTVIPGAKNAQQALANFAAGDTELSENAVKSIHALWKQELKNAPLPW